MENFEKVNQIIKEHSLKEVFNYKEYSDYMENRLVRVPRTYTVMDFMTDEEINDSKQRNITDLSIYDPTPVYVQKHLDFSFNLYLTLKDKYKNNALFNLLNKEEIGTILISSTNWYEAFGFKYEQ